MKLFTASGIQWDADEDAKVNLPQSVSFTERYLLHEGIIEAGDSDEDVLDQLADALSDEYGWCVEGFGSDIEDVAECELNKLKQTATVLDSIKHYS